MKCPVCSKSLSHVAAGPVDLEGCTSGCGGLWFDATELDRLDEKHEVVPESVLRLLDNAKSVVDRASARSCPKCPSATLQRVYFQQNENLEIDGCPTCGGIWLDLGELRSLRDHHAFQKEAHKVMKEFEQRVEADVPGGVNQRAAAVFKLLF